MRDGLVCLSHAVGVLFLLEGSTLALVGCNNLSCQAIRHRLLVALARVRNNPLNRHAAFAAITNRVRDLESCSTYTATANFYVRSDSGHGSFPLLESFLSCTVGHLINGRVKYFESSALLSLEHQVVHEIRDVCVVESGIRNQRVLFGLFTTHDLFTSWFLDA